MSDECMIRRFNMNNFSEEKNGGYIPCIGSKECFFFANAPIPIAEVETDTGIILNANSAYISMLDRPEKDVIGMPWMRFTPASEYLQEIKFYCDIFDKIDSSFTYKKKYLRPDGSAFSMVIKAVAIDFRPRHRRHIVIVYDVDIESRRYEDDRLKLDSMESKNSIQTSHVSRDAVINALVSLSMFRDRETGEHLYRTKSYVYTLLGLCLHRIPLSRYGRLVAAKASMLHDIGKVGIPDAILLKKGKLDEQEMSMIMTHTYLGVKALQESLVNTGYDVSLLFARDIVMYHHERWDGKGYPCGLSGEDIPFLARVMAIADVYDALRSERPYKQAMSHETSVAIIVSEKGSHFDPYLVDLFHENNEKFDAISKKTVDNTFS